MLNLTAILLLAGFYLALYGLVRYFWAGKGYDRDVLALGGVAVATLGFFWRILFTDEAWMPAGGGDLASFLYPIYRFSAESLRRGEIPLWNPYLYGGAPFAADIQAGIFYPINFIFFFLTPEINYWMMEALAVFHFFLAGAFMYLCLRYLHPGRPLLPLAALGGALAFMFSDYFITHFGNLNLVAVGAWGPLIFLLYHRALVEKRSGLAAGAGACLGMAALAGHIHPLLFIAFCLLLYFLYRLGRCLAFRKPQAPRPPFRGGLEAFKLIGLSGLTVATGLGMAALVLLPAYEMSARTLRADFSYDQAQGYSPPPAKLIGLLLPHFFGRDPAVHWGPWERVEVGYIGILPLVLAAFALVLSREEMGRFWAGLAVLSLLLALGGYNILHGWLYLLFPGFDKVRAPARFVYLMDFALAGLSGLGLDALLRPLPPGSRKTFARLVRISPWFWLVLSGLSVPLAYSTLLLSQDKDPSLFRRIAGATNNLLFFLLMLALSLGWLYARRYRWLRAQTLGFLAGALILVDLAGQGAYLDLGEREPTEGFNHPQAIAFLKSDKDFYRIDTRTEVWHLWQPNTSLLHRIFDVWGIVNPLILADYHRYWESMGSRSSPLYDFLNAKYVVGRKDVVLDWEKFVPIFEGDPKVNLYLNRKALPRALLVHRAMVAQSQEEAFRAIHEEGFNPANEVVVEGGKALNLSPAEPGQVSLLSYSLNEMELSVQAPAEGYLVLSEVYYPGWEASVDGKAVPLLRANYAFRAIYVEGGEHNVRLVFSPLSWKIGLAVSLASWGALVMWGALYIIRKLTH